MLKSKVFGPFPVMSTVEQLSKVIGMLSSKTHLAIALLGIAVFLFVSMTTSAQNSTDEADSRIRALLIEKRDVLASRLKHVESQFATGELSSIVVLAAKLELLDSELALAATAADRIKILKQQLDIHRTKQSQVAELYLLGKVTFSENVDVIVERIDAEVALSRETGRK